MLQKSHCDANISDCNTGFFFNLSCIDRGGLKCFELLRVKIWRECDMKGNKSFFDLVGGLSHRAEGNIAIMYD